jgi:predicted RND superfamily exporter protein
MSASTRVAAWLWDWRRVLATLCVLVTLLAAWQAGKVGTDNSLRIWFLDDDPYLVAYRSYQERFGSDEVVVIAFSRPDGMTSAAGLALLRRAEARLLAVEGVAGVVSIATLLDEGGASGDAAARERALRHPALLDRLISRDGNTAAVVVRMQAGDDIDARRDTVLRDVERALAKVDAPHHVAGIGVLYVALNRLSMVDATALFLAAVALMFVVLGLVYRRLASAVVTLGVAVLAMIWTMGLYGACGRSLNMVTSAMPTVILVVGVAEMVHILLRAARQREAASRRERAIGVLGNLLGPCTLNIVTSAAGFAALAASPLPAVRDLGLFTAAGLLGSLVLTAVGAVLAIAWGCEPRASEQHWLAQIARRLSELGIRYPRLTVAGAVVLALAAAAAGSRVVVDTYTLEFLPREHQVRHDSEWIESRLAPYVPMDFLVRAPGGARPPELLEALGLWQRAGERLPGVGWSRSPADAPAGSEQSEPRIGQDGALRVTFSVRMQSSRGVAQTMQALLDSARMPPGVGVEPAGYLPLYVRMVDYIVDSQLSGFALAFIAVFGIIALAFRSMRMAALALPSNLLPLVFILGVMGVAGIRLDAATVTIAAVVLGLVVDDTVHFLHALREALERCADRVEALRATVAGAGRSILTTALVMSLGFSVFALSEIRSLVYFGLLIALAMAASVLIDLLLIPALVMLRPATVGAKP